MNRVPRSHEVPDNFKDTIKQTGEIVKWCDIQSAIGVDDYMSFCRACWLCAVGSPRAEEYESIVVRLVAYCNKHDIYAPEEDQLPVILESIVGKYLTALGIDDVTIYNEFRDKKVNVPVRAFSSEKPIISFPEAHEHTCAIIPDEHKLMFMWGYDDTYGFLCMSEGVRLLADPADFFEGQYAGADTYCDWLNPVDFFERKPTGKTT